jgi:prevent-host-death family protein
VVLTRSSPVRPQQFEALIADFFGPTRPEKGTLFRTYGAIVKRPSIGQDLVPVNEFRSNMATYLKRVSHSGRPVILTQRGRAAAVLIDPAMLDEIEESQEVVRKVMRGLEDGAAGRTVSSQDLFSELETIIEGQEAKLAD